MTSDFDAVLLPVRVISDRIRTAHTEQDLRALTAGLAETLGGLLATASYAQTIINSPGASDANRTSARVRLNEVAGIADMLATHLTGTSSAPTRRLEAALHAQQPVVLPQPRELWASETYPDGSVSVGRVIGYQHVVDRWLPIITGEAADGTLSAIGTPAGDVTVRFAATRQDATSSDFTAPSAQDCGGSDDRP